MALRPPSTGGLSQTHPVKQTNTHATAKNRILMVVLIRSTEGYAARDPLLEKISFPRIFEIRLAVRSAIL